MGLPTQCQGVTPGQLLVDLGDAVEDFEERRGTLDQRFQAVIGAAASLDGIQGALGLLDEIADDLVAGELAVVGLPQLLAEHPGQIPLALDEVTMRATEHFQCIASGARCSFMPLRRQYGIQHQTLRREAPTPGKIDQASEDFALKRLVL